MVWEFFVGDYPNIQTKSKTHKIILPLSKLEVTLDLFSPSWMMCLLNFRRYRCAIISISLHTLWIYMLCLKLGETC